MDADKIKRLDDSIVETSKKIKVLNTLAWPAGVEETFLDQWKKKSPKLPEIKINRLNLSKEIRALEALARECDEQHPVGKFLAETANSYANAGHMLEAVGTPDFTRYSSRIYGRPDTMYKLQGFSGVAGANFFLDITEQLLGNKDIQPTETGISANEFASWLRTEVDEFFMHDAVEVVVDPNMSSKALAGSTRIRIRGNAIFSQLDKDQLLFHEAYVHTATQLNGKKQENLKCLGLGAPRTTRTQEGIAVLAELITNSMDLTRLRRIALRVIAVKMALDGADFIDLFKFFLDAGQTEVESVRSTQRIFRGGAVKDKIVFTKDSVYLQGLGEVHTFLRLAIRDNKPNLIRNLFAGRLTMADALRLEPQFESGWLKPPVYLPPWATDLRRFAASMAYSAFVNHVKLDKTYIERAIELEEELKEVGEM